MPGLTTPRDHRELVIAPREHLIAGGPAEQLEQQVQFSFKQGVQRIYIDLRAVPVIDSAGIRALVRGHTSAERLKRQFAVVAPNARVSEELRLSRLDQVLTIVDSLTAARTRVVPWRPILTALLVAIVGGALVGLGIWFPEGGTSPGTATIPGVVSAAPEPAGSPWRSPLLELAKLVVAALVGVLVTLVQRYYRPDRPPNPTLEQAQVLLCVAGALMMIIIGSSLPRAFGIAGAASIIRFRTPVEDARDITVLFIMMGLGMAAGLGGFAVAGMGTLFLCAMFPLLALFAADKPRQMLVEIEAEGREFPVAHVQQVFAVNHIAFDAREIEQGEEAKVRYLTTLGLNDSLEDLTQQLMHGGKAGLKNVSWSPPKKG